MLDSSPHKYQNHGTQDAVLLPAIQRKRRSQGWKQEFRKEGGSIRMRVRVEAFGDPHSVAPVSSLVTMVSRSLLYVYFNDFIFKLEA